MIREKFLGVMKSNKDSVKKAGVLSNQRSTASAAWILRNAKSDFKAAPMAWTGPTLFQ